MPRRYLIVGTGAAGMAAVEEIRRCDPRAEITLIGQEADGYYSRPGLAYYLTRELPQDQLYPFDSGDLKRLNARRLHSRAVAVDAEAHRVTLQGGAQLSYDRLLVATGSSAFIPDIPGVNLQGVVKLDTLDDAREIVRRSRRARAAVVVGGGITALELVEGLRARRVRPHYFLRRDRYWSGVLDEIESRIVEHRLAEEGVRIHYRTELAEILGKRGRVAGVRTKDGRQIPCQMVGIAVGVRPNKGLAEAAGFKADRGILVDETLQTSAADVFAAGDVAQVFDPFSGQAILDTLWGVAVAQGRVAGQNMAGLAATYQKSVAFNVTRLAGLTTTIIGTVGRGADQDQDVLGIVRGDSETWRQLPDAIAVQDDFEVNRLRVLVGKRRLLGGIVMGDQTLSQPLYQLIARRADIAPIHHRLLEVRAPIADIIFDFWIQWRQQNATAHL